jgi:hypothetical protein
MLLWGWRVLQWKLLWEKLLLQRWLLVVGLGDSQEQQRHRCRHLRSGSHSDCLGDIAARMIRTQSKRLVHFFLEQEQ